MGDIARPKAPELHAIARQLYEICYFVESQIVGQKNEEIFTWWAKKNAFRHAFTASKLLQLAREKGGHPIIIANLSGLSCGHQDFALCNFLQKQGIPFTYSALEHPNSPYLGMPVFREEVARYGIQTFLADLRVLKAEELIEQTGHPDLILFTEIAEHLEHSSLLRAFQIMAALLSENARIILTTPNMDYWRFRLKHLIARPASYWGEGLTNMNSGLFGHIVYYGIPRLRHLLGDFGLTAIHASTFSFPYPTPSKSGCALLCERIEFSIVNSLISAGAHFWRFPAANHALITLGEVIYLEVGKGERHEIPLAL